MWCSAVPVGREVVEVCGVSVVLVNVELGDHWVLYWLTLAAGIEEVLETEPYLMLSVREPVPKLSMVTSSAADWSPFVTVLLLPLMVVEVLWSLLLLLLL